MQTENVLRLQQAFPRIYGRTRIECADKWFSLLMTAGARLESEFRDRTDAERAGSFVEVVLETSDGLEMSMHEEDPRASHVLEVLRPEFRAFQRTGEHPTPYLWTHNASEQTTSEEIVAAEREERRGQVH